MPFLIKEESEENENECDDEKDDFMKTMVISAFSRHRGWPRIFVFRHNVSADIGCLG